MRLGIVIPLKAKSIAKSWGNVCDSLKSTLNSLITQDGGDFVVSIAGHDKPQFLDDVKYKDIHFCSVDFSPPDRNAPGFSHTDLLKDKNKKIFTAMMNIRDQDIDYWFQLDSDDLLRKDFCQVISKKVKGVGAVLDGGYLFYQSINRVIPTQEISVYCGSSSLLSSEIIQLPKSVEEYEAARFIWNEVPHMNMHEYFTREHGKNYQALKEPLLMYLLASGDNISDRWRNTLTSKIKARIKPYIKGRKVNKEIAEAFALDHSY